MRLWHKAGHGAPDELPRLIEELWLEEIAPATGDDCAATCLFAVVCPDGAVHIGAVGDGLAVVRSADGAVEWVSGPRAGFATDATALGSGATWSLRTQPWRPGDTVVLATDGVSDDLLPDRVGDFAAWLVESFAGLDPVPRLRALRSELTDWPTPRHLDDKTLAVLWARDS